jgi:hypothetical protein
MSRRFWTSEESARLRFLWTDTKITAAQIAALLERTERAVFHHVEKLELPPRPKFWTQDEDERLKRLWPDRELALRQIAEQLGISEGAIDARAQRLGLPPHHSKRAYRHWTPERNNTLRRLWLRGIKAKGIANQLNSTPGRVWHQARKLGLPLRVVCKSRSRWTPERNETLRRLWMRGISAKEIAHQLDSLPTRVCRQRFKLGLPPRTISRSPRIKGRRWRLPKWTPEPNPPPLKAQRARAEMKEAAAAFLAWRGHRS